jgi:hypothetical protein
VKAYVTNLRKGHLAIERCIDHHRFSFDHEKKKQEKKIGASSEERKDARENIRVIVHLFRSN